MHRAEYFEPLADHKVHCSLCPQDCTIRDGRTGFCRVRQNRGGVLYSLNYGQVSSIALDPIEKKPLYHFFPGSFILSAGTVGCNLRCGFCQNWQIAQQDAPTFTIPPAELVAMAKKRAEEGNIGIAYTYSEPGVWYEYVKDCAQLAKEAGLKNVLVTNGYLMPEPLAALLPYVDAVNLDIKAFTDDFYRRNCAGHLPPILQTAEIMQRYCHLEITTLVVPGENDSEEEIGALARWIAKHLGREVPLHLSRYFPNYRFQLPPTPILTLHRVREAAEEYLQFVYLGNVGGEEETTTFCPECGRELITRGRRVISRLQGETCPACGTRVAVFGKAKGDGGN